MSVRDLIISAENHFRKTTISYPEWRKRVDNGYKGKPYDPAKTEWGKGLDALDQALQEETGLNPNRLHGPEFLTILPETLFTAGVGGVIIRRIHISNNSSSPVDATLSIGTDAATTRILDDRPIPAHQTLDLYQKFAMAEGEIMQGQAGEVNALTITISGLGEVGTVGEGFDIPTYQINVGSGTGLRHEWVLHTSPNTSDGQWGGIPLRQIRTPQSTAGGIKSWEWWGMIEFKLDNSWPTSDGSDYACPLDYHGSPDDIDDYFWETVSPFHLRCDGGNFILQHGPNYPDHEFTIVAGLTKNVWHSCLIQMILGRTDNGVPSSGHPNGGNGQTRIWMDGEGDVNNPTLDTGNINNLHLAPSEVVQTIMDDLEGTYGEGISTTRVSQMTAHRWATTLAAAKDDSSITFQEDYPASNCSYSVITSRNSADFQMPSGM